VNQLRSRDYRNNNRTIVSDILDRMHVIISGEFCIIQLGEISYNFLYYQFLHPMYVKYF
jgi:hypothetical protein